MGTQIDRLHQQVSLEFRNPLAVVGEFAKSKLNEYMRNVNKETANTVSKITTDRLPLDIPLNNTQSKPITDFSYSDIAKVHVFVPTSLKPNAHMLEYSEQLLIASEIAVSIIEFGGSEILDTLNRYIGLPRQLRDLTDSSEQSETTANILKRVELLRVEFEKITNASGVNAERPYGKAYRRNQDFIATLDNSRKIQNNLNVVLMRMNNYKKTMSDVEAASKKLLSLIESRPEEYALGNVAATRIVNTMHAFATEAEFVGATIQNSRVFLKCIVDTVSVLENVQSRFKN